MSRKLQSQVLWVPRSGRGLEWIERSSLWARQGAGKAVCLCISACCRDGALAVLDVLCLRRAVGPRQHAGEQGAACCGVGTLAEA